MRKIQATILILLYFASTVHAGVTVHFCCDQIASISLNLEQNLEEAYTSSDGHHIQSNNNCCKDEVKQIKVSHAQNIASAIDLPSFHKIDFTPAIPFPVFKNDYLYHPSVRVDNNSTHSPPLRITALPVYLIDCSFLI